MFYNIFVIWFQKSCQVMKAVNNTIWIKGTIKMFVYYKDLYKSIYYEE